MITTLLLTLACSPPPEPSKPDEGSDTADTDTTEPDDSGDSGDTDTELPGPGGLVSDADLRIVGASADAVGNALDFADDMDGDGLDELVVAASFRGSVCVFPGATITGGDLAYADATTCYESPNATEYAGYALTALPDLTGDGVSDLLVGAIGDGEAGSYAGRAYVLAGPPRAGRFALTEAAFASWLGEAEGDWAGSALSSAGDVDGNGHADFLVGAVKQSTGGSGAGAVYLVHGPVEAGVHSLAEADARFLGAGDEGDGGDSEAPPHGAPAAGDGVGAALAGAGDFDGDGFDDVVLGANGANEGALDTGEVALFFGPVSGDHSFGDADRRWFGGAAGAGVGDNVSSAGDLDADGYADVLVAGNMAGAGTVWVLHGPAAAGALTLNDADVSFSGDAVGDQAGAVLDTSDLNGDGRVDVVIGAYGHASLGAETGGAFVFLGPLDTGARLLADADAAWLGDAPAGIAGRAVAAGGDTDGDGMPELLVGAPYSDAGEAFSGAAYLFRPY
ncbi:MAG: hypothetical protein Q8P41_25580 [Pseudomonadota bacterium]|nr:hypothetical protein [Pseudomonadota bacterium]